MDVWSGVGQCFPPLAFALPYLRFFITWLFKKWLIEVFNLCRLYLSHCFSVHTLRTIIGILLVKIQGDSIFMEYVIVGLTATDCVFLLSCLSCVWLCATLWTLVARLLYPRDSPGMNTEVGCHALLQGIFPTQGSNQCLLCLLHWQTGSLPLPPPGKPWCKDPQTRWLKPRKFISRSSGDKVASMIRFWRGYSSYLLPSCYVPAWQRRRALRSLPFLLRALIHSEATNL